MTGLVPYGRPLTLDEWYATPEAEGRYEQVEGFPVTVPPTLRVPDVVVLAGIGCYVPADPGDPPHLTVFALHDGTYAVVDEGPAVTADGLSLDAR